MGRASLKRIANANLADLATLATSALTADSAVRANQVREGTPVNAKASSLTTALNGDDNDLVYTAKVKGVDGDNISIEYVDPADDAELDVSVVGQAITVTLGYASGAITSTAADIKAKIEATPEADALAAVENAAGNNGNGLVTAMDATHLAGGQDGTVGTKNEVFHDNGYVYVCTADNTINDANWKRGALSSY